MGRILDVLRRKKSQTSSSPKSGELCHGCSAVVQTNQSRDNDIDKENEKPKAGWPDPDEIALPLSLCVSGPLSINSFDDEDKGRLDLLKTLSAANEHAIDSAEDGVIRISDKNIASHFPTANESLDEFTQVSDEIALLSSSGSEHSSEAAAASVSEVTEISDDGVLRDDEGNPIDPNEAEENMLRDDEGNIIDPKTLVLRDSFVDISCESSHEYCDGEGRDNNYSEQPASFKGPIAAMAVTGDRQGDVDKKIRSTLRHDATSLPLCDQLPQDKSPSEIPHKIAYRDEKFCRVADMKERRNAHARRQKRHEHRSFLTSSGEYVHILFHKKLSTLVEESVAAVSSRRVAEKPIHTTLDSRSTGTELTAATSHDEKFIQARWEFYLQVMNTVSFVNKGPLLYAMDEINSLLRLDNSVLDDCSVELETGEI